VPLPILKSATKNFVAANSEISRKMCRCRFRNRQPKALLLPILKLVASTVALPIQKLAAKIVPLLIQKAATKNFVAADSEIGIKIVSIPIQKLAASNCAAADLEIDSKKL
jgi:hypothetical protein